MTNSKRTLAQLQATVKLSDNNHAPIKRFFVVDDDGSMTKEFLGAEETPGGTKKKQNKKNKKSNASRADTADVGAESKQSSSGSEHDSEKITDDGAHGRLKSSVGDKNKKKKHAKNRVLQMSESDSERSDSTRALHAANKKVKKAPGARVTSASDLAAEEHLSLLIAMREEAEVSAEDIENSSSGDGDDDEVADDYSSDGGFVKYNAAESDSDDEFLPASSE
jgi:delta 1-pyrroline-5-carboxylate dehydrogenase